MSTTPCNSLKSFDKRTTLSRLEARDVYDSFAVAGHPGGKDANSGYGGPAVSALIRMAKFWNNDEQQTTNQQQQTLQVLDYGCGQGKLAELVLSKLDHNNDNNSNDGTNDDNNDNNRIYWKGIDQSPKMVEAFQKRCIDRFGSSRCSIELLKSGDPRDILDQQMVKPHSIDRFVSTYCLDLLSEEDIYHVLDVAEQCLKQKSGSNDDNNDGLLLLAGITWGYWDSIKTFGMTMVWELAYRVYRKKVGGCRPQTLEPYLKEKGWEIVDSVRTQPNGYPWMVSEVLCARPPPS